MLKKYALAYYIAGQMLEGGYHRIFTWEMFHQDKKVLSGGDEAYQKGLVALEYAKEAASRLSLGNLDKEIERVKKDNEAAALADRFKMDLKRIGERFRDELDSKRFLYVVPELVKFYGQEALFGSLVFDKWKAARDDIKHAGNCLSVGESTACVFHLMRALEVVVRRLGRRLGMTITPQTTWRVITGSMDGKIKNLPDKTDRQRRKKDQWEAARTSLHHVGSVWRNRTMHPATSYTSAQALDVYNATRVFMNDLCEL